MTSNFVSSYFQDDKEYSLEKLELIRKCILDDIKCGIIDKEESMAEFNILANKITEQKIKQVKKVHTNVIQGYKLDKNGNPTLYRTRAAWAPSGRLQCKTLEGLYLLLFNHYFGSNKDKTFEEFFYAWIDEKENSQCIEYLTAEHCRCDYIKFIKQEPFAHKKIEDIKKSEILSFYKKVVGNGNITKRCFGNIKTCINGAFNYANTFDDINCLIPFALSTREITIRCKSVDNSDKVYSSEDRDTLLNYLENIPSPTVYSLGVQLAFCLTTRIGELRAITWDKVDIENRVITLDHSIVNKKTDKANRGIELVDYMKAHSSAGKRSIPLSEYAIGILMALKEITGTQKFVLNSKGENPISTNAFNEHLRTYCKECNIEYLSSHKIRFYQCSNMYEQGVDEKVIQKYMGHTTLQMTQHYDRRKAHELDYETVNQVFGR